METTTSTTQKDTVSKANTDEKTRELNVKAREQAKADMVKGKIVPAKKTDKTVTKTVTKPEPVKKEKKPSMAAKWDEVLLKTGKWTDLVAKCQAATTEMGGTQKISIGTLKAHINYRIKKDINYLKGKVVTAEGLEAPKKGKK